MSAMPKSRGGLHGRGPYRIVEGGAEDADDGGVHRRRNADLLVLFPMQQRLPLFILRENDARNDCLYKAVCDGRGATGDFECVTLFHRSHSEVIEDAAAIPVLKFKFYVARLDDEQGLGFTPDADRALRPRNACEHTLSSRENGIATKLGRIPWQLCRWSGFGARPQSPLWDEF